MRIKEVNRLPAGFFCRHKFDNLPLGSDSTWEPYLEGNPLAKGILHFKVFAHFGCKKCGKLYKIRLVDDTTPFREKDEAESYITGYIKSNAIHEELQLNQTILNWQMNRADVAQRQTPQT